MSTLVTKSAPSFTTVAVMPDKTFQDISLTDFAKRYIVLFFYPLDFTFVCPTEIIAFSDAMDQFDALETTVLGCSVDSQYSHLAWVNTPRHEGGLGTLRFPLLSDLTKKISEAYGVLLPEAGVALRGLFLIDKNGIVQHELVNNLPLGRSVPEAIRMVRAVQFVEKYGEVCPANWDEGKPVIEPVMELATANGIRES
ncbi:MAG: peroxiredoxin [Planctomycetia bacterium]|nr:peroxiredoxin [Planctomycetia bacterium]